MRVRALPALLLLCLALPPAGAAERRFVIDPKASTAAYEVEEWFLGYKPPGRTVGRTSAVSGFVDFDPQNPAAARLGPVSVDLSLLRSDISLRDDRIRGSWLESARFPLAKFVVTRIGGLPARYAEGEPMTLRLAGNLTIRDVTRSVTFTATVRVNGDVLTGRATADLLMTDFGFEPPNVLGFVRAENEVRVVLDLTARAAR